jgi:hypothetical protein
MVFQGYKKPLMQSDLHKLSRRHDTEFVANRLEAEWDAELDRRDQDLHYTPSFGKALVRTFWREFSWAVVPLLIRIVSSFGAPFLLRNFIQFIQDTSLPMSQGLVLLFMIFVSFFQMLLTESLSGAEFFPLDLHNYSFPVV